MSAVLKPEDHRAWASENDGWTLSVEGELTPKGTPWAVTSRFGSVTQVIVPGADGNPAFTRPEYREAPNVNMIAWGKRMVSDVETICIAIIHQARPHADDPRGGDQQVVFGQVPMGFLDKMIGVIETVEEGAVRELVEEVGTRTTAVRRVYRPSHSYHNPNPTFVATWSDLAFVEVDLDVIDDPTFVGDEIIYKAEYVPVPELLRRIAVGEHEGALYRGCTSLSLLMIFFAAHPDFFAA